MEMAVLNLQSLYDEMRSQIDLLNDNVEPSEYFIVLLCKCSASHLTVCCTINVWPCCFLDFIQMAKNFDDCRRRWASTEQELGSCKQILTKTETERGALEVKLKHARNQVDIEIRRRQKAETECEKLVCASGFLGLRDDLSGLDWFNVGSFAVTQDRQIQLIRDLLTSEGSSNSIQLSAEQRSALGFLNTNYQATGNLNTSRR